MKIETIGVIGAGQMGHGIAQVAAYPGGLKVILHDIAGEFVERGFQNIGKNLDRLVAKSTIDEGKKKQILGQVQRTTRLKDMQNVDFIIEAATEKEDLKLDLFRELDAICRAEVVLASNTSSIPITRIAGRPTGRKKSSECIS